MPGKINGKCIVLILEQYSVLKDVLSIRIAAVFFFFFFFFLFLFFVFVAKSLLLFESAPQSRKVNEVHFTKSSVVSSL